MGNGGPKIRTRRSTIGRRPSRRRRTLARHPRSAAGFALALAPLLILFLSAASAEAFSSGPPPENTGAPLPGGGNEATCADGCHASFPLDSGEGAVTILAPADYLPGELVEILLVVEDPDALRWGFQLTAIDEALAGVGSFVPDAQGDTQVVSSVPLGRDYIEHTSQGTSIGQLGSRTWTFDWQAPESDAGPVTFYATGNAANNAGGNTGDRIYSTSATLLPEPGRGAAALAALWGLATLAAHRRRR